MLAEARGKRRARQIVDVADLLQADTGKSGNDLEIDAKRGKRKFRQRFALLAGRQNFFDAMAWLNAEAAPGVDAMATRT